MHKQPHHAIAKIADNRYWQTQPRLDDREELGTPKELGIEDYAPPTLTAADLPDGDETARFDDSAFKER
jgi:hypothetical protein